MRRLSLVTLAAVLMVTSNATAQSFPGLGQSSWGPRVQITPFGVFALGARRVEYWNVASEGGNVQAQYDIDMGMGAGGGLSLELRAVDRFALVASALYLSRAQTHEHARDESGLDVKHLGSTFVMARAALAVRLNEAVGELQMRRLVATVFGGPMYMQETPKPDATASPVLLEPSTYWGANFGLEALMPLPYRRISLQLGIEDWVIWWDDVELARRNDEVFASLGYTTQSTVETNPTHHLLFRAGFTLRVF